MLTRSAASRHVHGTAVSYRLTTTIALVGDASWLVGLVGVMVGVVGAGFTGWLGDRRRYAHERFMRVFDRKLDAAIEFRTACDRLWRTTSSADVANYSLSNAEAGGNQASIEAHAERWSAAVEVQGDAFRKAESAFVVIDLILPETSQEARVYLDLCHQEDWRTSKRTQREAAKAAFDNALWPALKT